MAEQRTDSGAITDESLHRFFDGELPRAEEEEVRKRIEADPALRAKLDGLRELRAVVRASLAGAAGDVASDDLWAKIQAGIAEEKPAAAAAAVAAPAGSAAAAAKKPALVPIAGGKSDAASAGPTAVAPKRGATVDPRRRWAGIAVAGLALAAAVLLIVLQPGETPVDGPVAVEDPVSPVEDPVVPDEGAAPLAAAEEQVFRTEVLEVDFGENSGAIFAVEGEDGDRYAVVWLADIQPKQTAAP